MALAKYTAQFHLLEYGLVDEAEIIANEQLRGPHSAGVDVVEEGANEDGDDDDDEMHDRADPPPSSVANDDFFA